MMVAKFLILDKDTGGAPFFINAIVVSVYNHKTYLKSGWFYGCTPKNFRLIIYICVYNPKNFSCMINRELYMEQITPFIDKPFVKVTLVFVAVASRSCCV